MASRSRKTSTSASAKPRPGSSAEVYANLVENCTDGIIAFDRDLCIRVWNRGMCVLTGLRRDQCVGEPVTAVVGALGLRNVDDALHAALQGKSDHPRVLSINEAQTGEQRTVEATIHPISNHEDRIVGGMILVRDVTSGQSLQRELVESERKHRRRFMHSAEAILILDREGRYIDANPAVCELTGYTRKELLGMRISALSIPGERPPARDWFRNLVRVGTSRAERVVRRKDGLLVHTEVHAIDLGDGTFQVSIRDISERRASEERLHETLQRLRFHIERMPLGYIGWSANMEVLVWNPACEQIFGWSAREMLGRRWDVIVPDSVKPRVAKIIDDLLGGDISSHSINRNIRKDGTVITCEWFNTPLRDSSGTISGAASMVHDVTERTLAESQRQHAQKMESLGVLTRGIAHDFGNLLTVVRGNLTLLENLPNLPKKARAYVDLISEAAMKGSDLTEHMLTFARTGRHNPQLSNLNDIVREALKLVGTSFTGKVKTDVRLDDNITAILVDRSQIEQVIMNLCLNAHQAMRGAGTISIRARQSYFGPADIAQCLPHDDPKPATRVELVVADDGDGIAQGTISRIFDPFYTTKTTGHGLGLSAVLGILKQHASHVVTKSTPGHGASFHIYFPIPNPIESQGSCAISNPSRDGSSADRTTPKKRVKATAAATTPRRKPASKSKSSVKKTKTATKRRTKR